MEVGVAHFARGISMRELKAFVGSSNDLRHLREKAIETVDEINADLRVDRARLHVECFDYTTLPLDATYIQENINPHIAGSDCVSLFIGCRLGPGTAKEFELST